VSAAGELGLPPLTPPGTGMPCSAASASVMWSDMVEREGNDGSLCFALQREMLDVEVVCRFTVLGEPVSKQRPRFAKSRGRVYTPGGTKAAETKVGWAFRAAAPAAYDLTAGSFGVYLGFFCEKGQRRDVDNMTKLVLDGLNGVAWNDDSQVSEISAKLSRFDDDPRTEVVVYRTITKSHPEGICVRCGSTFPLYKSSRGRKYCSKDCQHPPVEINCQSCGESFRVKPSKKNMGVVHCSEECQRASQQSNLVRLTCGHCGKAYELRPSEFKRRGAKFCSTECQAAAWAARASKASKGACAHCGGPTSKKTYTRCRACALSSKNTPADDREVSV
jgi:Holliday junction resolvase RusA-like endonuclease